MLQTYNVFWDTTGHDKNGYSYCYPWDSVTVLSDEGLGSKSSERMFNSKIWGTYKNFINTIEKLLSYILEYVKLYNIKLDPLLKTNRN